MPSFIRQLKGRLRHSRLMPLIRPRRFQAYCVGLPKTGTTSIGLMFRSRYRAAHEPLPERTREYVLQAHKGSVERNELREYLRWRDRELYLEMESSHPIAVFAADLAELFADSRFVLTVRSPRSWLDSMIEQQLRGRARRAAMAEPGWRASFFPALHDLCCGRDFGPHDGILQRLGLYPLDGYLRWWTDHNRTVLDAVPSERLLVMRTEEISVEVGTLASFLGIEPESLDLNRTHANRADHRRGLLDEIDPAYLDDRIASICSHVLEATDRLASGRPRPHDPGTPTPTARISA